MRAKAARSLALFFALVFAASPAASQSVASGGGNMDVLAIGAVVNDDVISLYDVEQRYALLTAGSQRTPSPEEEARLKEEILQSLIEDKLKLQEAQRNEVPVTEDEIQDAIEGLQRSNGLVPEQFAQYMAANNIERATLEEQIRASIAWQKLVQGRYGASVTVGEEEVDAVYQRLVENAGKPENMISEIFLAVDSPAEETERLALAQRLFEQIEEGANFASLAQQYSDGSTANSGGDIGWVEAGRLPDAVDEEIGHMRTNDVSPPIRAEDGYYIVYLRSRRAQASADPEKVEVALKQIVWAPPADPNEAAMQALMETAFREARALESCEGLDAIGRRHRNASIADVGRVKMSNLAEPVQRLVSELYVGQAAIPIPAAQNLVSFVLCGRTQPEVELPDRDQIESDLRRRRLNMISRRYLRDLRQVAIIDIRNPATS